ncbi:ribbon-helix-helix domain-containing protein [Opitutaceae bacterium TAV4]|nr:ribbon-helix-helix domain-containing protein [Opitutaceae bacterium TAV4]RRJ98415.1 ribbon-helix-helix domain-containing protein [Opitutaceae bacterium TAV3]
MALNNGINVRLTPEIREKLEALAVRHGVKASVLIRQAIIEKLDEVERESAIVLTARGAKRALPPPK